MFTNLGDILQGFLESKTRWNLSSKDFIVREFNYNLTVKLNVRCVYVGEYRRCCVIYKVTCK